MRVPSCASEFESFFASRGPYLFMCARRRRCVSNDQTATRPCPRASFKSGRAGDSTAGQPDVMRRGFPKHMFVPKNWSLNQNSPFSIPNSGTVSMYRLTSRKRDFRCGIVSTVWKRGISIRIGSCAVCAFQWAGLYHKPMCVEWGTAKMQKTRFRSDEFAAGNGFWVLSCTARTGILFLFLVLFVLGLLVFVLFVQIGLVLHCFGQWRRPVRTVNPRFDADRFDQFVHHCRIFAQEIA